MVVGISNVIVAPVARALAELGFAIDAVAPDHGIVDGNRADAIVDHAASTLGDDALGLTLATRIPIGALGDLDYAVCTSATLREGLARLGRFYGLITQRMTLAFVEEESVARLVFSRVPKTTISRHWVEFGAAIIATRIRQTLGVDTAFLDATFIHDSPKSRKAHDAFFGVATTFGAPRDGISFARDLLSAPLRTTSATLAEALDVKLRQLEPTMNARAPFLAVVRTAIVLLLDQRETGLVATAARLGMTTRTLQRQLGEHGLSHRDLLDEIRRERALTLLEQGKDIAEVSGLLGFSEPSAFFRAFRRWTGTSPRATVTRSRA